MEKQKLHQEYYYIEKKIDLILNKKNIIEENIEFYTILKSKYDDNKKIKEKIPLDK